MKIAEIFKRPGVYLGVAGIVFYRKAISPILHLFSGGRGCCRFSPTCSEFARQALLKYGFFTGGVLSVWRILRCNPFNAGGLDPVPEKGEPFFRRPRIGLFGGSFDPVHNAHLTLAREACRALKLDKLIFIPAAQSPLKQSTPGASSELRLAMLRAAIANSDKAEVSAWEIEHGGKSWSIRTVEYFEDAFPRAQFFWIFGADQLAQLDKWREAERLCRKVCFAAMCRDGDVLPDVPESLRGVAKVVPLKIGRIDLSSTEIRTKIADGKIEELRNCVPGEVLSIICENNLYRHGDYQNCKENNDSDDQARVRDQEVRRRQIEDDKNYCEPCWNDR